MVGSAQGFLQNQWWQNSMWPKKTTVYSNQNDICLLRECVWKPFQYVFHFIHAYGVDGRIAKTT